MYSYVIINLLFLTIAGLILWYLRPYKISARALALTFLTMFLLTVVFDNLIIAADIVNYNEDNILGIKALVAPIEDFDYMIVAALAAPLLWSKRKT